MRNKLIKCLFLFFVISSYSQTGVNNKNPQGFFHVDAKGNNVSNGVPTSQQQTDDFIINVNGNVGIGTTTPKTDAILDLNVDNLPTNSKKGFLPPTATLTSMTDAITILNPAESLIVYNTGNNPNFSYKGYVYWDGDEWRNLNGESFKSGTVTKLFCESARLMPSTYISGRPYQGVLFVPYTGGNGGSYPSMTTNFDNGLQGVLEAGVLAEGTGVLIYSVSGIPGASSPSLTNFNLSFPGSPNCTASFGVGEEQIPGQTINYFVTSVPAEIGSGTNASTDTESWLYTNRGPNNLPTIEGKLRVDGYFLKSANVPGNAARELKRTFVPRFVNISNDNTKFWYAAISTKKAMNGANLVLEGISTNSNTGAPDGAGWINLEESLYSDLGQNHYTPVGRVTNAGRENQELLIVDVDIDNKWYRVYYFLIVDNMGTVSDDDNLRKMYITVIRII